MDYAIRGAWRETGLQTPMTIYNATSRDQAIQAASDKGVLVAAIEEMYPAKQESDENFEHIVIVDEPWPEGFGASILKKVGPDRHGFAVAGITREPQRMKNLAELTKSPVRRVYLERDPTNPFDANAIKVIAKWWDTNADELTGELGYLSKDVANQIVRIYPQGPLCARILSLLLPLNGRHPGIRIDPGRPAKRRSKKA